MSSRFASHSRWRTAVSRSDMRHTLEMVMKPAAVVVAAGLCALAVAVNGQSPTGWPAAAGDVGATKYSAVDQLTPANVTKLAQAWTYQPAGPSPIVVNNFMYFVAGGNVVAPNTD